jgi:hypothetical protein
MRTRDSLHALRRANPRADSGFVASVDAVGDAVRAQLATADVDAPARHRVLRISAAGASLAAVAVAVFLTLGALGDGTAVEDATAAVKNAARVTATSAERSGTAVVRITHDGELWAGSTIRWHGGDLTVMSDAPRRLGRPGSQMRLVDGMLYGVEDGEWVILGSPASIDPDSGTTPAEYLAATRADVGGATLRRLAAAVTGLTVSRLGDDSTVYRGKVPAGLVAREASFKGDQPIRVFPFGYVAHDQAADPSARLAIAITVGDGDVIYAIDVSWGTWRYTVTYSELGATAPIVAPANARPLRPGR